MLPPHTIDKHTIGVKGNGVTNFTADINDFLLILSTIEKNTHYTISINC
jgi:hypothetical protein